MVGEREAALKEIIEEYVERGWLEPSFSEWGSPCFVVPKKTPGDWRLVVDYRALNEVTLHDSYELPLISEMLQKQQAKRLFTVLDMKKGVSSDAAPPHVQTVHSNGDAHEIVAMASHADGRQERECSIPKNDGMGAAGSAIRGPICG